MESSAGQTAELSTVNVGSEAGTNADGTGNMLHGEDLQNLHAGQSSQQGLRQRCFPAQLELPDRHDMHHMPGCTYCS